MTNPDPQSSELDSDWQRQLIDMLRNLGVDKYIQLPQIAVMGDTSSGKSSVLSALSGIQFPSSDRLTTRCPTQLILQSSKEFKASVRLHRFDPKRAKDSDVYTGEINAVGEITAIIAKYTQQLVDEGQSISDDSIVINLFGPALPNLTLIDLPGLVRTVDDHIHRIRNLVDRYLNQDRTIILAVVPANVDMHNTEILQAAEAADPKGDRTISVITKPDLIDEGSEDAVLELLNNKKKALKLGYHMLKCRGQKQLNEKMSIEDGIKAEAEFFASKSPWNTVSRNLIGTENLKSKLCDLLESRIKFYLPVVSQEISNQLKACKSSLLKLGPVMDSSSKRFNYYYESIRQVSELLQHSLTGNYANDFFKDENNRLRAKIWAHQTQFRDTIAKTREPCLGDIQVGDQLLHIPDDDIIQVVAMKSNIEFTASFGSEFDLTDEDDHEVGDLFEYGEEEVVLTGKGKAKSVIEIDSNCFADIAIPGKDIATEIKLNRGKEIPLFPNFSVFFALVKSRLSVWEPPTFQLLKQTNGLVANVWRGIVNSLDIKPKLAKFFLNEGETILEQMFKETEAEMKKELEREFQSPYTLNHYLFDILIKLRNQPLLDSIERLKSTEGKVDVNSIIALLKQHGVGNVPNEEREVIEMQYALAAYIKVATKRFIDNIPMLIERELIDSFSDSVFEHLKSKDDLVLKQILSDAKNIEAERKELSEKETALTKAEREIVSFQY